MKSRSGTPGLHQGLIRIAVASMLPLLFVSAPSLAAQDDEGFVPLFNGRDLTGWIGDARLWKVENGVIVGSTEETQIERNSFLSTTRSFSDFTLRVSVKLIRGNSGIQFRSEQHPGHVVKGYQADIADANYFGMLYDEGKRGMMDYWKKLSPEEKAVINSRADLTGWNRYEISCEGRRVRLILNGHLVCDITDPKGSRSGIIALQLHTGPPMRVLFKDIEIKSSRTAGPIRRDKERFRAAPGFQVEQAATDELLGSLVNLTFDHLGRPVVAREHGGVHILLDKDGDGRFEGVREFSNRVQRAHGMHYLGAGDLLVQSNGPEGPGLYRLVDEDGDDQADSTTLIAASRGRIGEHGPHAILTGMDGNLYLLYGNHAYPDVTVDPGSPSRGLHEDHLLERYLDPRGHANSIRVPAGTIHRLDLSSNRWTQFSAGFRNAFDFALDPKGEIFTFDSDMEWDFGLPWYRPIRVIHAVPGGDYGWRTGSGKFPGYYPDSLPAVESLGRGSPVGIAFYQHRTYPRKFHGALFLGDWSRGRIRVSFPEQTGASYVASGEDFVSGEPLNVTDLDVGPDGFLYFSTGGRSTSGGLYRVRYAGATAESSVGTGSGVREALTQPMHRSAWGQLALTRLKSELGPRWEQDLVRISRDRASPSQQRVRALESLQTLGPAPGPKLLSQLSRDEDPKVRAAAVLLLGTHPLHQVSSILQERLGDSDPLVARRSAESLLRAGLDTGSSLPNPEGLARSLYRLMDHSDRFVRHAARLTLERMDPPLWTSLVLQDTVRDRPRAALEGLLALIRVRNPGPDWKAVLEKILEYGRQPMTEEIRLGYLRICQLAFLRDPAPETPGREKFASRLGSRLLDLYPTDNSLVNRELETLLGFLQTPGAIGALLRELKPEKSQPDQIHTVYALRSIKQGWSRNQRNAVVEWFDRGWQMPGAASMHGYITRLWEDVLSLLPPEERAQAEAREEEQARKRAERVLELISGEPPPERSRLIQMSFEELSTYLEFDPGSYERGSAERGRAVFHRAKCSNCHVFGSEGRGGGPDLSTAVKRFRRSEILEALMFPSKVISDQYTALIVEAKGKEPLTGMLADENEETLTLIDASGERIDIPKNLVTDRRTSQISIMPEELLETMTLQDLVNLFLFLERGSGF